MLHSAVVPEQVYLQQLLTHVQDHHGQIFKSQ